MTESIIARFASNWACSTRRVFVYVLALFLLGSNLILFSDLAIWIQYSAAYCLTILLPAYLIGDIWFERIRNEALEPLERFVFMLALGYATALFVALGLSYIPGPLAAWRVQTTFTLLTSILLLRRAIGWHLGSSKNAGELTHQPFETKNTSPSSPHNHVDRPDHSRRWQLAAVISVIALAALLRLPSLGYSEFQNDEISVLIQATEEIQGRSDALFVHDKGPNEILLTATLYTLVGRTTEFMARLPFAIANIAALIALLCLGWRMFGAVAGWTAALLMAVDGYFIGFSQIVQYQSLVALMAILAILAVYLSLSQRASSTRLLLLGAYLLATGVLAHYEAILVAIPILYFLGAEVRRYRSQINWRGWLVAAVSFVVLASIFYIPFATHPRFARTFAEITGNRIGAGFPYNNLNDFFTRTLVYSSTYYFALMVTAIWIAWFNRIWHYSSHWQRWVSFSLGSIGLTLTFVNSQWLTLFNQDQTWIFFALFLALALSYRRGRNEDHALWLWFGLPFVAAIFFVQKPRTHVYNFFLPWSLLVGIVADAGWRKLRHLMPLRAAQSAGLAAVIGLVALFANYEYWLFTYTRFEVLRTWDTNRPPGYWFPFDSISQNAIFGFPFKNGWKVVGSLYAQGELDGALARNGERGVTEWYTRGGMDCARDARYFVYTKWNEPVNKGLTEQTPRPTEDQGFQLLHVVQVNGETRLEIFDRLATDAPIQTHDVADFESYFNDTISNPDMQRDGPIFGLNLPHPIRYRFGDHIHLIGYSVADTQVAPGQQLDVTLFWRTEARLETSYKVFNQIINLQNLHKAGQRDGIPGCERYATDTWSPGDLIADRYRIWIARDAPPGSYTHLLGLYDEQEERLPIFDATDQFIGDAIPLYEVIVTNSIGEE